MTQSSRPGGHGPPWDLAKTADSIRLIETFAKSDRPIGAVCHAPAIFKAPEISGCAFVSRPK